jgi:hypothetical protein
MWAVKRLQLSSQERLSIISDETAADRGHARHANTDRKRPHQHGWWGFSVCCGGRMKGLSSSDSPMSVKSRQVPKFGCASVVFLLLGSAASHAQSSEKEPAAVVEVGGAFDRSLTAGQSSFGPTVAVEFTPIENWLELEAGLTPLFRRHSTEWSTDLLFKKPWTLSEKTEFMLGVGPEWIHTNAFGAKTNSVGFEVAPDFMFWPSKTHRFGWYLEPSYEYKFGTGHEHSLGITGGLLIAIP